MHPTVAYEIAKARIADQQRRAGQNALVQAARRAHRTSTPWRLHLAVALAHRVVTLGGQAGAARPRSRPQAACSPSAPCAGCI